MATFDKTSGLIASTDGQQRTATLDELYGRYYARIYGFCVRRLFCKTAAEDVTSQIFLNVARGFDSFKGQTEQAFACWLYAIAVNQCNAYLRKNLRRQKLFRRFQQESGHDQPPAAPPAWPDVYAALLRLKKVEQTIITLRFFESMSYAQIAAIINKRQSTVRVILHRSLKRLRTVLNSADGGFDRGGS